MSVTSCGRRARQRTKATATSTASRMPNRISHFRRACEWVRCGGCGTDVSTIARRPSVEVACGSVWDAGARDESVRDRSACGNISFHPLVRGPPLAGQTARRVRYQGHTHEGKCCLCLPKCRCETGGLINEKA